jgi:rhodanese-related sulfurtransferase
MSKKKKHTTGSKAHPQLRGAAPGGRLPPWIWLALAGLIIVIIAAVVLINRPQASQTAGPLPKEIAVAEAYQKYQAGTFFLDVREQSEWDEYHAPNATLIPLGTLESRLGELPRDRQIVVVCRSGNRSQQGRDILLNNGFTQVASMAGGMKTWREAGYPVEGNSP